MYMNVHYLTFFIRPQRPSDRRELCVRQAQFPQAVVFTWQVLTEKDGPWCIIVS